MLLRDKKKNILQDLQLDLSDRQLKLGHEASLPSV